MVTRRLPEPWATIVGSLTLIVVLLVVVSLLGSVGPLELIILLLLAAIIIAFAVRSLRRHYSQRPTAPGRPERDTR